MEEEFSISMEELAEMGTNLRSNLIAETDYGYVLGETKKEDSKMTNKGDKTMLGQNEYKEINSLEVLKDTGKITGNLYFFFNLKVEKFMLIDRDLNMVEYYSKDSAQRILPEYCERAGIDLSILEARKGYVKENGITVPGKKQESILSYVKNVYSEFNILKPIIWNNNFYSYVNEFNVHNTELENIKAIRESNEVIKGLDYLKSNAPHTYALLLNLFEYSDTNVEHFINYLSCFVNTREKIRVSYMFAGIEGSGKGILMSIMKKIFGKKYVADTLADSLAEQFNDHLENKLIVNLNEVSTDFTKKNVAIQQLKKLITDETFDLHRKGIKKVEVPNNFIVFLNTNEVNSVKISATDRRFNYFKHERTLKDVAESEFNLSIDKFVNIIIEKEFNTFVKFLAIFDFNKERAGELIETESKATNVRMTENRERLLFKALKDRNYNILKTDIINQVELSDQQDLNKMSVETSLKIQNIEDLLCSLRESLETGFIPVSLLNIVCELVLGEQLDRLARARMFERNGLHETITKRIDGQPVKCRIIK